MKFYNVLWLKLYNKKDGIQATPKLSIFTNKLNSQN